MSSALRKSLVALALLLAACGKRGDPRPPVPVIPQATSDLVVTQRANKVVLSWSYPALTTAGKSLPHVRRVVVYRYVEALPAVAATGPGADPLPTPGPDPNLPAPIVAFSKVPGLAPAQFNKLRERIDSIEGSGLPAATSGAKLTYTDEPTFHSTDGRPVRITYSVVTESDTAHSELSNLATIIPLNVATPPKNVKAAAKPAGIDLTWSAPAKGLTGEAPVIIGYNVYRTAPGETPDDFDKPVNQSPVTSTNYTDAPPYGAYDYRVSAVASSGPPRIESANSGAANATFKDLVPPPAPASVTALLETRIVRLIWDPVDVPDLQGYNVYRTEGNVRLKLTPHPAKQTFFGDESIVVGTAYFYSVTAVDKNGNEGEPAKTGTVLVPR